MACKNGTVYVRFRDFGSAAAVLDNVYRHGNQLMAAYVADHEWPDLNIHMKSLENSRGLDTPPRPSTHASNSRVFILACAIAAPSLDVEQAESSVRELLE